MVLFIIQLIDFVVQLLVLLLLVNMVLSFVMSPWHPVRQWVDRIVEPMLAPIRRVVPLVGMLDFSPLVLLILVQIVGMIVKSILLAYF